MVISLRQFRLHTEEYPKRTESIRTVTHVTEHTTSSVLIGWKTFPWPGSNVMSDQMSSWSGIQNHRTRISLISRGFDTGRGSWNHKITFPERERRFLSQATLLRPLFRGVGHHANKPLILHCYK